VTKNATVIRVKPFPVFAFKIPPNPKGKQAKYLIVQLFEEEASFKLSISGTKLQPEFQIKTRINTCFFAVPFFLFLQYKAQNDGQYI
jgi:hypothetical protein